jgi:hypothetical protein
MKSERKVREKKEETKVEVTVREEGTALQRS